MWRTNTSTEMRFCFLSVILLQFPDLPLISCERSSKASRRSFDCDDVNLWRISFSDTPSEKSPFLLWLSISIEEVKKLHNGVFYCVWKLFFHNVFDQKLQRISEVFVGILQAWMRKNLRFFLPLRSLHLVWFQKLKQKLQHFWNNFQLAMEEELSLWCWILELILALLDFRFLFENFSFENDELKMNWF